MLFVLYALCYSILLLLCCNMLLFVCRAGKRLVLRRRARQPVFSLSLSLSIYIYIYIYIYTIIYIYIYMCIQISLSLLSDYPFTIVYDRFTSRTTGLLSHYLLLYKYGQFSKFRVCFCGLDPGDSKFETARTNKQHICF